MYIILGQEQIAVHAHRYRSATSFAEKVITSLRIHHVLGSARSKERTKYYQTTALNSGSSVCEPSFISWYSGFSQM